MNYGKKFKIALVIKILSYILLNLLLLHNFKTLKIDSNENKPINKTRKFYSRNEALTRARHYLDLCLEGKLMKNQTFYISEKIKITVIIPIYNGEKNIKGALFSIQNQKMKDIEIILSNDFSTDNSLSILKKLKEEDPRIRIINNKKHMGTLYTRSFSVLKAKGEYVIHLDHDDFFADDDVFDVLYEEAKDGNFDIISFMPIDIASLHENVNSMRDGYSTRNKIEGYIVKQPILPYYFFFVNQTYQYVDVAIWGKIFKTEIYKKAVNLLGKERYSFYNIFNDDQVGLFAIGIIAESYKYIKKYGIIHIFGHGTSSRVPKEQSVKGQIFFIDVMFDLSKNEYKKYATFLPYMDPSNINGENKLYFDKVFNKIMNSNYIEDVYKEKFKNHYIKKN